MHFVWRLAILLMVGLAPSVPFAREALPRSVLYLDENDPGLPFAQATRMFYARNQLGKVLEQAGVEHAYA